MFLTLVLGSGIGAVGRSTITNIMKTKRRGLWATLLVNLLGCLIAGLLLGVNSSSLIASLLIGFIGGFTTYSTFNGELASFFFQQQYLRLCSYLLVSYGGGLLACYLGYQFIQII
ncbi:fluoride efflux transporter FluC [Fructilactobacillus cliffordii]|uniref:Fluoride-specific ion channel FluC n=1 Tax=Fructilactobacillus cliffordii TaxID=2940299 RepID=A0A9Q8ZWE5_9LACO|nr:CrcB family protein [Fructilactobacillus cliffordii]USS89771.1 CrcB family protein [Fructilactobacillus cliffordii]